MKFSAMAPAALVVVRSILVAGADPGVPNLSEVTLACGRSTKKQAVARTVRRWCGICPHENKIRRPGSVGDVLTRSDPPPEIEFCLVTAMCGLGGTI